MTTPTLYLDNQSDYFNRTSTLQYFIHMKIINPSIHALLDYVVVIGLVASPSFLQFTDIVTTFTYILAGIHLLLTLVTDFPGGLIKIIPLKFHGVIELLVSIILLVVPWLLSFTNTTDRYYYTVFALIVFFTWTLTDYSPTRRESVIV